MLYKYYVPFILRSSGSGINYYERKIAIVKAATKYQAMLIVCGTYIERDNSKEAIVNADEIIEVVDFTDR